MDPAKLTRVRATANFSQSDGIVRHGEHVLVDLEDPGISPLVEKGILVPVEETAPAVEPEQEPAEPVAPELETTDDTTDEPGDDQPELELEP